MQPILSHQILKYIDYPVSCLVSLYMFTGCDYVEGFQYITSVMSVREFVKYAPYICSDGSLVIVEKCVNQESFLKLIGCIYLSKYVKYFPCTDVKTIHDSLSQSTLDTEYKHPIH